MTHLGIATWSPRLLASYLPDVAASLLLASSLPPFLASFLPHFFAPSLPCLLASLLAGAPWLWIEKRGLAGLDCIDRCLMTSVRLRQSDYVSPTLGDSASPTCTNTKAATSSLSPSCDPSIASHHSSLLVHQSAVKYPNPMGLGASKLSSLIVYLSSFPLSLGCC